MIITKSQVLGERKSLKLPVKKGNIKRSVFQNYLPEQLNKDECYGSGKGCIKNVSDQSAGYGYSKGKRPFNQINGMGVT